MSVDGMGGEGGRYVGEVVDALVAAGYQVTDRFTEPVEPTDYVIRVTLPGGTVADLVWDTLGWRVVVHPYGDGVGDSDLSQVLTYDADPLPAAVLRMARPVLDEAQRRWALVMMKGLPWDQLPRDVAEVVYAVGRFLRDRPELVVACHDPAGVYSITCEGWLDNWPDRFTNRWFLHQKNLPATVRVTVDNGCRLMLRQV